MKKWFFEKITAIYNYFFEKKKQPLVKTAARKEQEDSTSKVIIKLLVFICISLSTWTLYSTHEQSVKNARLEAQLIAEEAARIEQVKNLNEALKSLKEDYEKKFAETKNDSERRFSEIKKDLENISSKIDFLLTRKTSP